MNSLISTVNVTELIGYLENLIYILTLTTITNVARMPGKKERL